MSSSSVPSCSPVSSSSGSAGLSPLACTALYNTIDPPVGIVLVTHVDPKPDALSADLVGDPRKNRCTTDADVRPSGMAGVPVCVQIRVVGRKQEDEKVLEVMRRLEWRGGFKLAATCRVVDCLASAS